MLSVLPRSQLSNLTTLTQVLPTKAISLTTTFLVSKKKSEKFFWKFSKILTPVIAQRNTKLLEFYSRFDKRCKILGYVLKAMAKSCGVADASRGSISSYGYTLLLIHYLQVRKTKNFQINLFSACKSSSMSSRNLARWSKTDFYCRKFWHLVPRRFECD